MKTRAENLAARAAKFAQPFKATIYASEADARATLVLDHRTTLADVFRAAATVAEAEKTWAISAGGGIAGTDVAVEGGSAEEVAEMVTVLTAAARKDGQAVTVKMLDAEYSSGRMTVRAVRS